MTILNKSDISIYYFENKIDFKTNQNYFKKIWIHSKMK